MTNDRGGRSDATRQATFGAGCFWGVEEAFRLAPGVVSTVVGYAGGRTERPTYGDVCSHETGHAEVVAVTYDPDVVSYADLLDVFWAAHDPTRASRQSIDFGGQYRSVIFVHDGEQESTALASRAQLDRSGRYPSPVVTEISPVPTFHRAEDHHQQWRARGGMLSPGEGSGGGGHGSSPR